MEDLIALQNAHVTQLTHEGVKGDWVVKENITMRELAMLDARISDQDMFAVLRFARKYELIAFNAGIDFQKDKQNVLLVEQVKRLREENAAMIEHSDRLALTVERLTAGENNGSTSTD